MKQILPIVLLLISTYSCSYRTWQATTTHKQVMDGYKNKDQVISRFGFPTTRTSEAGYEEWYYDYGTKSITSSSSSSAMQLGANKSTESSTTGTNFTNLASVASNVASGQINSNTQTNKQTVTENSKIYIKFIFKGDQVLNWDSRNVDYGDYAYVKRRY